MKINVALFITALSTTAAASAGDDGAATTATTIDRPNLRALQTQACSAPVQDGSCDDMSCDNCSQGASTCTELDYCVGTVDLVCWTGVACCNPAGKNCYDPQGIMPTTDEEDSMFIKADEEEEEEEVPQDTTTTTDKLGDEIEAVVPSSSTLRASSLLKDNVFAKYRTYCPAPQYNTPTDYCQTDSNYCGGCSNPHSSCWSQNTCDPTAEVSSGNCYTVKCCASSNNDNNCYDGSAQADEEDAVMIKADEEEKEEEVPQDTTSDKLGAPSSTLRASSLLKDNVFNKEDGDGAEDFLQEGCDAPKFYSDHYLNVLGYDDASSICDDPDNDDPIDCSGCDGDKECRVSAGSIDGRNGKYRKCCDSDGSQCVESSAQADEEDAASLLKVE